MALPNGRILGEVMPLLRRVGIEPEPAFDDPGSRQLRFATSDPGLDLIRVRSFDVATFVAFGAAQLGVAGNDVLMEFDYSEIYAPLDLDIGHCRIAVAAMQTRERARRGREDVARRSHIRVATKYPEITRRHFAARGVQAECIKLNGAIELAPRLGLCRHIVDLVQTGATLQANGLVEIEHIADVSSRLIVNRPALKTRPQRDRRLDRALSRRDRRSTAPALRRSACEAATPMPITLSTRDPGFEAAFARLLAAKRESAADVDDAVAAIIDDVRPARRRGAVRVHPPLRPARPCGRRLRVPLARSPPAAAAVPAETIAALRVRGRADRELSPPPTAAADRLRRRAAGVRLGARWRPIAAVGLYVPGGTAAYPSSVLMNAIPAKVAGVARLVMTVPTPDGVLNPLVLAAAALVGVDEIYRIGGAQAVAALAYGTATIAAGRQDRRARQRLCRRGQAARLRPGRHRHDRRPVRDPGRRRPPQRPGLDRRRPAVAGRARHRGAGDPDHRRRGILPRRSKRRSKTIWHGCRAPRSRGRAGGRHGAIILVADWDEAPALIDRDRARASRAGARRPRRAGRAGAATPARSFSAATRPKRSATISPAPTMCCRRRAARALPRASACSIF